MQIARQIDFLAREPGMFSFQVYCKLGGLLWRQIDKSDNLQDTDNDKSQNRLNDTHVNLSLYDDG
jgi:hypothetical protein